MSDKNESVFTEAIRDTLPKTQPEATPPADIKSLPVGRLLNWILNYWEEPTITVRNICQFGPRSSKTAKEAVGTAEILVKQGWLVPVQADRIDQKRWLIVRGGRQPDVNHRTVETVDVTPASQPSHLSLTDTYRGLGSRASGLIGERPGL